MASNNDNAPAPISAATKLRQRLNETDDLILLPGVYDGFSARIALEVGFDGLYMTGAGTSASKLGLPDLGYATLDDMRSHAEMLANLDPFIPLVADADTGYGGPNMVARTVTQYARSGVAGLHIEDQVQTKRCGHLIGKQVVDTDVFVSRIKAAALARRKIGSDIVVIARTDAIQTHGFDEALRRLRAAVEAGADVAFLEGVTSAEQARTACKDLAPTPVLLNMVEHGATPSWTAAEAKELGYRMMIVPFAAIAPAYEAIRDSLARLKETGVVGTKSDFSPRKLFSIVGLQEAMEFDKAAGGSSYSQV
ncbi:Pyruvate/Phosphoenolpyruvate kinase-like domain-containing protein [Colletotrichum godetiae]|uniref:Pyruvate/Phosphoenolpyruvate kinase-like domain-containing protein n=1 Tax=Colletotrichum godetiae TaxID=1209918 RepID=A0AAJ0AWZ2_9PEZI|nr:Pyruvate/Phosphoenolpyruvate kinase-like domain-containing protein [Colletotrichum godetiae]KAK1699812.1 Pyruvate/Phosphoenolpyruvate kinase-like domain-containing protein [Colletotrichum godetiae]